MFLWVCRFSFFLWVCKYCFWRWFCWCAGGEKMMIFFVGLQGTTFDGAIVGLQGTTFDGAIVGLQVKLLMVLLWVCMYNFWWCYFGCEGITFDGVFVGLQVQRQDSHHANSAEPAEWGVGALHVWVGQDGAAQGRRQQRHLPLHPALLFHASCWTPPPPASLRFSDWPVRPRVEQLRLTQLAVTHLLFTRLLDCWSVCTLSSGMAVACENEVYMAMKLTFGGEGENVHTDTTWLVNTVCLTGVVITFYINNMISKHWCFTGVWLLFISITWLVNTDVSQECDYFLYQ